ncbi:L-methionine (R)-S-oxide reductase, partial [Phenoliferia sp. Uapishka_3]
MSTHADSLAIPAEVVTKADFYSHITHTLQHLLSPGKCDWVTALSNASALMYGSFENKKEWGKRDGKRVNWSGFYMHPDLFPSSTTPFDREVPPASLLLGPFQGRPACLSVTLQSNRALGVCASSFVAKATVLVPDVDKMPGHIACDGVTRSEIVVPILVKVGEVEIAIGVLDVDCERLGGFDEEDRVGLELFVKALVELVDWKL